MKLRRLNDIEVGFLLGTVVAITLSDILYSITKEPMFFILIIFGAGAGFILGAKMKSPK
jgi:hypothetical protein